jgi:hypothetical protein
LLQAANRQGIRLPGKTTVTGKAQIGVKVALTSPLSSMEYFHPIVEYNNLPYKALSTLVKIPSFPVFLENPSNACVPSTISVSSKSSEPTDLSGSKRELEEEVDSDWIPPYRIKIEEI